jgi:hypothetical protein
MPSGCVSVHLYRDRSEARIGQLAIRLPLLLIVQDPAELRVGRLCEGIKFKVFQAKRVGKI